MRNTVSVLVALIVPTLVLACGPSAADDPGDPAAAREEVIATAREEVVATAVAIALTHGASLTPSPEPTKIPAPTTVVKVTLAPLRSPTPAMAVAEPPTPAPEAEADPETTIDSTPGFVVTASPTPKPTSTPVLYPTATFTPIFNNVKIDALKQYAPDPARGVWWYTKPNCEAEGRYRHWHSGTTNHPHLGSQSVNYEDAKRVINTFMFDKIDEFYAEHHPNKRGCCSGATPVQVEALSDTLPIVRLHNKIVAAESVGKGGAKRTEYSHYYVGAVVYLEWQPRELWPGVPYRHNMVVKGAIGPVIFQPVTKEEYKSSDC